MRKVFIALTLLIATAGVASAQHVEFGVKGGLNESKFSNADGSDYKFNPSFHLGVLAHVHLNKMFAVQPELVYSVQGTKFKTGNENFKYNLNYINIPVLLQLMTENGFRFETGPQVGFLASANAKSGNESDDIKNNFKSTAISWAFGVGYITASKLGFDARYNAGLTDIAKSNEINVKNSVLQVGIFYQFK